MPVTRLSGVLSLTAEDLTTDIEPFADRVKAAVLAAYLPVILTSVLIGAYLSTVAAGDSVTRAMADTAYGIAGLVTLGAVYAWLNQQEWGVTARFERPSRQELLWTAVCFPASIGAFLVGSTIGSALGFELSGVSYTLTDYHTLAAVVFGGILVAPVVEELLYRGLLLDSLLARGLSPAVAGGITVVLFGSMHIISLGVAGVLATTCWAVFPTLIRLKFNNLTGAWLLHFVNNIYSYILLVALGIA